MAQDEAIRVALEIFHVPSQVRLVRSRALPLGVVSVLQIAAGDEEETTSRSVDLKRSPSVLVEAASFFIEQILLEDGVDNYRLLGTTEEATAIELRRNMALLMIWAHPDKDRNKGRSGFAKRFTQAWTDLKSPEKRLAYDALLADARRQRSRGRRVPLALPKQRDIETPDFVSSWLNRLLGRA